MNILNKYSNQKETRSFWKQRLIAIILSVIVSISLLLSVLLITIGNYSIQFLHKLKYFPSVITPVLLFFLNYGLVIFIILLFVSCIYYFAPSKSHKWRFFSAGSVFACISIVLTTTLFSYNKVYGSIGVIIVILLLIYINTYILLMGFELNVAIDKVLEEIKKGRVIKANRVVLLRNAQERNEGNDDW
jgi:membrane protein